MIKRSIMVLNRMKRIIHNIIVFVRFIFIIIITVHNEPACAALKSMQDICVTDIKQLQSVLNSVYPGECIILENGSFQLTGDLLITRSGTELFPIIIRARNRGQTEFVGQGEIIFDSVSYVIMEGFTFRHTAKYRNWTTGNITVNDCHHVRITRNVIRLNENVPGPVRWQQWLAITGEKSHHNRVDHNLFDKKTLQGDFLVITGDGNGDQYVSQYDRVDHNHFREFKYANGENMYETIRVGSNRDGNNDVGSHLTIDSNLFERCCGEIELLSFKCGDNYILNNTFIDCLGSVSLRNGNRDVVAGNYFFNNGKSEDDLGVDGIMFYGSYHKIFNNYFENLEGCNKEYLNTFNPGLPYPGAGTGHGADVIPATRVEMIYNTWVNCNAVFLGYIRDRRPLAPQICLFANNIIYRNEGHGELIRFGNVEGFTFCGNIIYETGNAVTDVTQFSELEFKVVDPELERLDGIWRLSSASSPAVNQATLQCSHRRAVLQDVGRPMSYPAIIIHEDIDGQKRDENPDVGVDEWSLEYRRKHPLTPKDVGPDAY